MWGQQQKISFQTSKKLLISSQLLVHFNPEMELILASNASAYEIGAVLANKMPVGTEKPVGYAPHILTKAEKNHREGGTFLQFRIEIFRSYLFGYAFTLVTDHEPLKGLLGESKAISP